jgi:hypothetical protein
LPGLRRAAGPSASQLGIAALQPLHPDVGGAERGGGHLNADARRLVDQHGDVAGAHEELLLDLLADDHLDPDRLILDAAARARALDDDLLGFLFFMLFVSFAFLMLLLDRRALLRLSWKG